MMGRRWVVGVFVLALAAAVGVWRWWVSATPLSAPGRLPDAPQRIASLTLATDELLAELVPPERVVCVTYLADDPEISNVAGRYPPAIPRLRDSDPERIIGLTPDLVCVASYNSADFLKVLERSGLPVYRNEDVHSMDEIEAGISVLGGRAGEPERARELVERMHDQRQRLAGKLREVSHRPRVLFWSAGFTAGQGSTIDDVIREGGGVNVAGERGLKGSAGIAPEQVIDADPEVILLSRWSADDREGRIENHPLLRNLRAVRENRITAIEGRYLTSVSHWVVEGTERLARSLHPECFGETLALPSPATAQRETP